MRERRRTKPRLLLFCLGLVTACGLVIGVKSGIQRMILAGHIERSKGNLSQIGVAIHSYHDANGTIPPGGTFFQEGIAYHSWQTMLLPFIESSNLYNRIDFDRSWTHRDNRPVFETTYKTFVNPCEPPPQPVDGYATSHYAGNNRVMKRNGRFGLHEFDDGAGQTIIAGEVSAGLKAWGDPTNTRDPSHGIGQSLDQFGRSRPPGTYFLMADGSLRSVLSGADRGLLRALATPNGGEHIPEF